jgi:transketolase
MLDPATGKQTLIAEDPRADISGALAHPTEKTIQAVSFTYARTEWKVIDPVIQADLDYLKTVADGEIQITGRTHDVMSNEPVDEKFRAFGWAVKCVNGHDYVALTDALSKPAELGKPTCVIANTVKGRGVSFMENVAKWHHGVPSEAELKQALAELDAVETKLKKA